VLVGQVGLAVELYRVETPEPLTVVFHAPPPPTPAQESGASPRLLPDGPGFSWITQRSTSTSPGFNVVITAKRRLESPGFAVYCDKPCRFSNAQALEGATSALPYQTGPTVVGIQFTIPAALQKDQQVIIEIASSNDRQVSADRVILGRFPSSPQR
jgi:hypothetical protein